MKKDILEVLKKNKDSFISGEELSNKLGVTRTSVWKHINKLKKEGYSIESVSRRGYKLLEDADILSTDELMIELENSKMGDKIFYFDTIDSTNNYAKKMAQEGFEQGTIVLSDEQTGGRGRLGRDWDSPSGTGLWMSIILKPDIEPFEAAKITEIAAAAVSISIEKLTNINTGIKWPNDIIINRKKVCGILTEMSAELNYINFVIVGIGINVNTEVFPEGIDEIATSIKKCMGQNISRKDLFLTIIREFEKLYYDFVETGSLERTVKICREKSVIIGNKVKIINKNNVIMADALDINENGELVIRKENGEIINIISGEVSVRGINHYI